MRLKQSFIIILLSLISMSVYAQKGNYHEVTVEDKTKNNDYMNHPDYVKNRQRFLVLDRGIDEVFSKQKAYYLKNIETPGYSRDAAGNYSKEKLEKFIKQAQAFKNSLKTNSILIQMCAEYNSLIDKVRPGDRNQCEFLMQQQLESVDNSIKRAEALLKDLVELKLVNSNKKKINIGQTNSQVNGTNNTKDSAVKSKRNLSEAIIGTWVITDKRAPNKNGDLFTLYFLENGTGYSIIPDVDNSCYPYYYKVYWSYTLENSKVIQHCTRIDAYCGLPFSCSDLAPLDLVIDSSGEILTDGGGFRYVRK